MSGLPYAAKLPHNDVDGLSTPVSFVLIRFIAADKRHLEK